MGNTNTSKQMKTLRRDLDELETAVASLQTRVTALQQLGRPPTSSPRSAARSDSPVVRRRKRKYAQARHLSAAFYDSVPQSPDTDD